ncbi:terminase small subunit [Stutzerimonas nitrititolerans]|uniref:terminase small subunit n=1 Tax=Stutzerimonas nitrititolerans TaxID=2482751 RepID=UPI00289BD5EE|nr:terminase small subunit [Stutzerimonas nitrititolerans]
MSLTPKQEAFCSAYLETGNASEAYRRAYNAENMKAATIAVKASELLANGKVAVRLAEMREATAKRNQITVDDLLRELEEARTKALNCENPQSSAAVSATLGKAKLLGLDRPDIGLDLEAKRLNIEKLRRELEDPNQGLPEPKQVIIGVEDASDPEAE